MVLFDVCVLLNAYFAAAEHHRLCRDAVEEVLDGGSRFAVLDQILSSVLRVATHPKIFRPPAETADLFAFLNLLRGHEHAVVLSPAQRHWTIFEDLVEANHVRGADITDAWLAAGAMEHGCELWTTDAGFDRFAGLRVRNLLRTT